MDTLNYDLVVFTNAPTSYAPKRIITEATKAHLKAIVIDYDDIGLDINNITFPKAKNIFIRGMGEHPKFSPLRYALINYYKKKAKILNLESFRKWISLDKITQAIELSKAGIGIPQSYFFGSIEEANKKLKTLPFPMIAKFNAGSRGVSVHKVNSPSELEEIIEDNEIHTLLFQEFLGSGEDLRVIILNGKVLGGMKRIAKKGNHLTNYSQGGSVENYDMDMDPDAKRLALSVSKLFKLDYCGVDLMKNKKGDWVVLEVNRACQFEGFEKSTGISIADKVVEYLIK